MSRDIRVLERIQSLARFIGASLGPRDFASEASPLLVDDGRSLGEEALAPGVVHEAAAGIDRLEPFDRVVVAAEAVERVAFLADELVHAANAEGAAERAHVVVSERRVENNSAEALMPGVEPQKEPRRQDAVVFGVRSLCRFDDGVDAMSVARFHAAVLSATAAPKRRSGSTSSGTSAQAKRRLPHAARPQSVAPAAM